MTTYDLSCRMEWCIGLMTGQQHARWARLDDRSSIAGLGDVL